MSSPSDYFRHIQRRQTACPREKGAPRVPAPAPAGGLSPILPPRSAPSPVPRDPVQPPEDAPQEGVRAPAPAVSRPARGHALYSEVMRSHDRMGTRHLPKRG
ncbi:MAG: hypothetical protein IJ124_08445 [Clostridia bacterium]|nr:hypothetical protein [Clostridia bacterium]